MTHIVAPGKSAEEIKSVNVDRPPSEVLQTSVFLVQVTQYTHNVKTAIDKNDLTSYY